MHGAPVRPAGLTPGTGPVDKAPLIARQGIGQDIAEAAVKPSTEA
ncbi:hypothetical protein [Streptomyces xantholiticus]|uniref:Uncharacterized protein n=1 Tax=Streptomyces xantholiticus TaxID=68285 RepID=A0ABV1UPZ0_9ACTN